jgi:hypothetical protein
MASLRHAMRSCHEKINDVVQPCATPREPGTPEGMIGIYGHVGHAVLRKMDNLRITISSEVNPAQVPLHDLSEYSLVVADHHEFTGRLASGVSPAC